MLKINLKNKKIYIILISLNTKKNFENNYYTILQTLSFLSLRYVTMGGIAHRFHSMEDSGEWQLSHMCPRAS